MRVPFTELNREWLFFEEDFLAAFKEFGRGGNYILGPATENFEKNFAAYHQYKFGIAVSTGLAALEIALLAHGVKPGDEVITVANSAVATSLAISNIGAIPVFCDINDEFLIDSDKIEKLITPKTKAILPVHLFGQICDMETVNKIAAAHNLLVIEDACQAHGARFQGASLKNTKAFSFYPTKNLGALGEGGLILTNEEDVYNFAAAYRNYGQSGRYNHVIKGNNYRADAFQCCLLDIKLKKLPDFIITRQAIAKKYQENLENLNSLILPKYSDANSYHLFVIRVENKQRNFLKKYLSEAGIDTLIHYPTIIPQQPCYLNDYQNIVLEKTNLFQDKILSLPCYPFLKSEEQDYVIEKIQDFFKQLS